MSDDFESAVRNWLAVIAFLVFLVWVNTLRMELLVDFMSAYLRFMKLIP